MLLRRDFTVEDAVTRAVFYGTGQGVYGAELNGSTIDDGQLNPGWTSYRHRLQYDVVDVTHLVEPGPNTLIVDLAGGWYTEAYGFSGRARRVYGDAAVVRRTARARVRERRGAGDRQRLQWSATTEGPRGCQQRFRPEHVDARRSIPEMHDAAWGAVRDDPCVPVPRPRSTEPVRKTAELAVVAQLISPSGKTILDFGQNLVGRLRIRVTGAAGTRSRCATPRCSRTANSASRPLRHAKATDTYMLGATGGDVGAGFTFHGFRYAEVTGWPGDSTRQPSPRSWCTPTWAAPAGSSSPDPLLNRLHENVVWGMRGNFLSVPTDCPQRDERLGLDRRHPGVRAHRRVPLRLRRLPRPGWTTWRRAGDATARAVRRPATCSSAPARPPPGATPPWSCPGCSTSGSATLACSRQQYASMRAWVDRSLGARRASASCGRAASSSATGSTRRAARRARQAKADPDLVATRLPLPVEPTLVARAAAVLGDADDAGEYAALADAVRGAFLREYVTAAGRHDVATRRPPMRWRSSSALLPTPSSASSAGDRLAELVARDGYRIGTGLRRHAADPTR